MAHFVGGDHWNVTAIQYDKIGRKQFVSLPYDSGTTPTLWTEYTYDNLSRPIQIKTPDGSISKNFYNEPLTTPRPDSASSLAGQTVKTQDAWGRERWSRTDAFGRLVEVVEPNPLGDGSVLTAQSLKTSYTYDPLNQLITTTQGSQTRSFRYDSLGRLTRQKLAEQTATIDDNGIYVGSGNQNAKWSDSFSYDSRSNLTQKIDARGVKTNFSYLVNGTSDPLNRLEGISYDTSSADTTYTINLAPTITLQYMPTGDKTRVWKVITAGISTEENAYDAESRISDYTLTLTSRPTYPMVTSYQYDTANRITQIQYPAQY
jgi:YD repeat-containing protein